MTLFPCRLNGGICFLPPSQDNPIVKMKKIKFFNLATAKQRCDAPRVPAPAVETTFRENRQSGNP